MKTIFVNDYTEMSRLAYDTIAEVIQTKTQPVVSLTTGGSPRGLFELLVQHINAGTLDISQTTFMNLDEYIGPHDAPYAVRTFMNENFYQRIKQQPLHKFLIDGATHDYALEITRYQNILKEYPRDIQLLGLGTNAHLGANEPGTPFNATMFLAQHDQSTIESTIREYNLAPEAAPTQMLTLGLSEILQAKHVVLIVSGLHKAQAVQAMLQGEIHPDVPASILRKHDNVTVIIDKQAASLL